MRRVTRGQERGFVFIITLMVLAGLMTLTMVGMTRTIAEIAAANRSVSVAKSFQMAEAGVDCIIHQLRGNVDVATASTACLALLNGQNPGASSVLTIDPPGGGNRLTLTSRGTVTGTQTTVTAILQQQAAATPSPFPRAAYGSRDTHENIVINTNSLVDSYDSKQGLYGGVNVNARATVQTASEFNNDDEGGVAVGIGDHSVVHGDVITAPPDGEVFVSLDSTVTGSITGHAAPVTSPSIVMPTRPASCDNPGHNLGDVHVGSGEVRQLDQFSSYCATSIQVDNGGQLSFPKNVELYVNGDMTVSSGGNVAVASGTVTVAHAFRVADVNSVFQGTADRVNLYVGDEGAGGGVKDGAQIYGVNKKPENLRLYINNGSFFYVSTFNSALPGAQAYAAIYAPHVPIRIQGCNPAGPCSAVYGAVIARDMLMAKSALHYDEALKDVTTNWPDWIGGGKDVNLLLEYNLKALPTPPPPPPPPHCPKTGCVEQ